MKKLISRGAILDHLDIDALMKEAIEVHLLTVNIIISVDDAMSQSMSRAAKVGSMYATLNQLGNTGAGGRLDAMHHALNMGDQNIGFFQQTLTGIFNIVVTLEQKMHHLYQNGTAQLIKESLTNSLRDDFEVWVFTLTSDLGGVRHLTEGGGCNTVVGDFKSLTGVTIWVQPNIPSDTPESEHSIDLGVLLAGISQTGVSSEEVRKK